MEETMSQFSSKEDLYIARCKRLEKELAESQAREKRLREAIIEAHRWSPDKSASKHLLGEAMYLPHDDTALKEYKRKVLMGAADKFAAMDGYESDSEGLWAKMHLRRMAEEV